MALTGRRDLFGREYLKDLNATAAARRAGYAEASAAQEGSRLLADPEVQAHIAALAAERNTELKIEARDVLLELYRIAQMDPAGCVNEDGTARSLLDIPAELRRTIASFEIEDMSPLGVRTKIKFWNKNDALNALGRHLALFKDVVEHRFLGGDQPADAEVVAKAAAIIEDVRRRAQQHSDLV